MAKIERLCKQCQKPFFVERGKVNEGNGKYCSRKCFFLSRRNRIDLICIQCGIEFYRRPSELKNGTGEFCSKNCRSMQGRLEKACLQCGKVFYITKSDMRKGKDVGAGRFCSALCRSKSQTKEKIKRHCRQCNRVFWIYPYIARNNRGFFCSQDCLYKWNSENTTGENHPNWRGGSSFEPYGLNWTKVLKAQIRKRDGHACMLCGKSARCVHHIDYCKTNSIPDNLTTLCNSCHSKTNFNRPYWQAVFENFKCDQIRC